ncbi:MAG: hypothetical protein ACJAZ7_000265, partial [Zhongshania aliphaticivorans]
TAAAMRQKNLKTKSIYLLIEDSTTGLFNNEICRGKRDISLFVKVFIVVLALCRLTYSPIAITKKLIEFKHPTSIFA